jgi:uncharacterized glyoxalase superfamily metalloenzyme YdcJ
VEQRGVPLTPRGRDRYDRCLAAAQEQPADDAFADFPDTVAALVGEELAYFRFARSAGTTAAQLAAFDLDDARDRARALAAGVLTAQPIRYEDFLPVSAAGIFRSNLDGAKDETYAEASSREVFERHLGCKLVSSDALYARQQSDSLASVTGADPGT